MLALPLAAALSLTAAAADAAPADLDAIRAAKRVHAVRTSEPVHLDGTPDEAAWQTAEPAVDFYQQQPAEGQIATRRSEVRFLYDATTLYVGAMLYDEEPQRAITNDLKRDFGGRDSDMFGVVLDTFHDRRNAYGFLTNPGGAQRETQAQDSGRRNDASWHGVWFARTAMHENAWSVELAIPFKTLRFPEARVDIKPFVTAQANGGALGSSGRGDDADGGRDLKWFPPSAAGSGCRRADNRSRSWAGSA
jgi:hypothetical protein